MNEAEEALGYPVAEAQAVANGVVQRHVVTKFSDGSTRVEDVSTAPSAPVGAERKYPDDGNGDDDAYNRGWNDCLDALAQQPAAVDEATDHIATLRELYATRNPVGRFARAIKAGIAALAQQPGYSDNDR